MNFKKTTLIAATAVVASLALAGCKKNCNPCAAKKPEMNKTATNPAAATKPQMKSTSSNASQKQTMAPKEKN
jgi:hypothetical protein